MSCRCGSWLPGHPGSWPGCPALPDPLTPGQLADLTVYGEAAAELLNQATCNRFGRCPVVLEVCNPGCCCVDTCGCVCRFDTGLDVTPWAPVHNVVSWTINGVDQNPGDLEIVGCGTLIVGGPTSWPNGSTIVLDAGHPVPSLGVIAAANLAVELFNRACGSDRCRLPDNITSASGPDGGTLSFQTIGELVAAGLTGIPETDLFISMFKCRPVTKAGDLAARRGGCGTLVDVTPPEGVPPLPSDLVPCTPRPAAPGV